MKGGLLLNRTRQVPAEDTAAFAGIAERFRRAGDLDRAITLCREGLGRFPTLLSARVTLGWALLDKGLYDEARAELEQVLRRAPDNLAAIRGLAELHDRAEHAPINESAWHQAVAAAGPTVEDTVAVSPVAVDTLDEPIRLENFDVSAPADAPVEFEASRPPTFADTPSTPVELEAEETPESFVSPVAAEVCESPHEAPTDTALSFVVQASPEAGAVSEALADDPVRHDAQVITTASDDIDFGLADLTLASATDSTPDEVVRLPASGEVQLEEFAHAFSEELSEGAEEPVVELAEGANPLSEGAGVFAALADDAQGVEEPTADLTFDLDASTSPGAPDATANGVVVQDEVAESPERDLAVADFESTTGTPAVTVEAAAAESTDLGDLAAETKFVDVQVDGTDVGPVPPVDVSASEIPDLTVESAAPVEVAPLLVDLPKAQPEETLAPATYEPETADLLDLAPASVSFAHLADIPEAENVIPGMSLEGDLDLTPLSADVQTLPEVTSASEAGEPNPAVVMAALDRFCRQAQARRLELSERSVA